MMLFICITYLFFLIGFSSSDNQCLSSNYCTCSLDLTIINCTNRQLTNELLLKLNNQLPNTTILLNLSSNLLTSIKSLSNLNSLQILDLSFNKIRYIPSNIFSKFPQLTSLHIQNNSITIFPKTPPINFLQIYPEQSQVVYENEQFILNCSSNSQHYWTLNEQFYPSTIKTSSYSTILIHQLQLNHSGIWTCHNINFNRSISLSILKNSSNHFCQSIQMNTSKGYFYWPRTLINKKLEKKCPFGSAAWLSDSDEYARAWFTCSSNGQWKNFDISQCGFQTNISRVLDYLSLNETNLLLNLIKYLSKINRNQMRLDDIILLIDLIDEQQEKSKNQDKIMLIYHLTDFILQIKHHLDFNYQYQFAITRLRLIIERLLDFTNQSWLYIGKELTAMTIQSPLTTTLCSIPNRSLLTIICDTNYQQSKFDLATIQFPSHSNETNKYSLFRVIVYRQTTLYISNETRNNNNNNPVIYIRPVSTKNFSTLKFSFPDQSNSISVGVWDANQTYWQMKSSICKLIEQKKNFMKTNCFVLNHTSLSITSLNKNNIYQNYFLNKNYSQLIISISTIIASICLIISGLFYLCFQKISGIPRRYFHCLINYWFNLAVLFPLFAFGIEFYQYSFLCQFIAISLHYLCLTSILWLTLLTYSIWKKLSIDKDREKRSSILILNEISIKNFQSNVILHFYFLTYGLAFLICGINVFISREHYLINQICFFNHSNSILIIIFPILICIFLILIFLLISRNSIQNFSNKSNEILTNLLSSNENSSTNDYQYESINHLLSILSQLILLICLFLSSLTIYIHPFNFFELKFEHIIYSHFYGFFILFLAFYILSFYVFSRSLSIIHYYLNRKKSEQLSNQSLMNNTSSSFTEHISILPQSDCHGLSPGHMCEISENSIMNDEHECSIKRLTNTTSKYYLCYDHFIQSNSSQNISKDELPVSLSDTISQETICAHQSPRNSFYEQPAKRLINIPIESHTITTPLHLSPLPSSRLYPHPLISPSQAIIRPLPLTRLSSLNQNLSNSTDIIQSNDRNSCHITSSSSIEEYYVIDKTNSIDQKNLSHEKISIQDKSPYDHAHVLYIDEDDERSVSLKSSIIDSKTSSCTLSTKKNHSQTLSISSSSSSSTNLSNQIKLHESSV